MDPEKAPLLGTGAVLPSVAKEPRQWRGSWYNPAGDEAGCSAGDAAACCLAFNAPHVAFGWNASRGLGLTWWKEALKLLLLTGGAFALVRLVLTVLVHTQCHPHPPHGAMMPHGIMDPTMMKHALPGAAGATVGSEPFVPNNLRGHWAGGATADKVSTATQTSKTTEAEMPVHSVEETDPGMVASIAQIDVMVGPDANQAVEHIPERYAHDDDDDDDEDEDDDGEAFVREFWHHHGPHDDPFHHHHDMPFMSDDEIEECAMRIAPAASVAIAFGIAVTIYAAYFAALRRRMLREKFGIEGSFRGDWLLWLCCAPCALTQETRTLMHNNVEEGLWHGPLSVPRQAVPMSA